MAKATHIRCKKNLLRRPQTICTLLLSPLCCHSVVAPLPTPSQNRKKSLTPRIRDLEKKLAAHKTQFADSSLVATSVDVTHVTSRFYKWPHSMYGEPWHTHTSSFLAGVGSTALLRRSIQALHKTGGELSFTARCLLSLCDIGKWSCYQRETFDRIFWLLVATVPY